MESSEGLEGTGVEAELALQRTQMDTTWTKRAGEQINVSAVGVNCDYILSRGSYTEFPVMRDWLILFSVKRESS